MSFATAMIIALSPDSQMLETRLRRHSRTGFNVPMGKIQL
jgi:hypothetical protein